MADQKLTQLTALASLSADDLFYVVDDPAGAALSRKMAASVLDSRYLQSANNLSDLASAAIARISLGLVIGTNVQAWDADLDTIAGLAQTDGNFIVGDGAAWVVESGATARSSLGLGSLAVLNSPLPIANGGSGQVTQQTAIDALTAVSGATNEYVLTKDTASGNAIFKASGAGTSLPVADTQTIVKGSADATKLLRFELDGFTAGATRVMTPPNQDILLAGQNFANVFTARQNIVASNPILGLDAGAGSGESFVMIWVADSSDNAIIWGDSDNSRALRFGTSSDFATVGGFSEKARFSATGQFGIGIQSFFSADDKLAVAGDIRLDSPNNAFLHLDRGAGSNTTVVTFDTAGTATWGMGVGIGTDNFAWYQDNSSQKPRFQLTYNGATNFYALPEAGDAVANALIFATRSVNSPAAGLGCAILAQAETSTSEDQNQGRLYWLWPDAAGVTHATRRAAGVLTAFSVTTERECLSWEATSTAAKLSFLGAARIARPATYTLAATATRTMPTPEATFTGQDNVQIGNVYAKFADLATLQTRLDSVEGVLRQLIIDLASTSGYGLLAAS